VVLANWGAYIQGAPEGWMHPDGIHLTPVGAYAVADYISRHIAHLSGAPCPEPLQAGGPIEPVCPNPDSLTAVPAIDTLYP
jgi:hypothetical protein